MRNLTVLKVALISLILLCHNARAQSEGDIITFSNSIRVDMVIDFYSGDTIKSTSGYIDADVRFRTVTINEETVTIKALNFTPLDKPPKNYVDKSDIYNNKIFVISRTDFNAFAKKYIPKERLSIGLLTLPFKARPQGDFTYDTEFNLNTTLNWAVHHWKSSSFNLQVASGIGTVGLNAANSNSSKEDQAQDVSILTFAFGAMIQEKRTQFGLYIGVDQINNQAKYQWKPNGNLWFGIGIGYNIFKVPLKSIDKEPEQIKYN